jgi:hypothetical protein
VLQAAAAKAASLRRIRTHHPRDRATGGGGTRGRAVVAEAASLHRIRARRPGDRAPGGGGTRGRAAVAEAASLCRIRSRQPEDGLPAVEARLSPMRARFRTRRPGLPVVTSSRCRRFALPPLPLSLSLSHLFLHLLQVVVAARGGRRRHLLAPKPHHLVGVRRDPGWRTMSTAPPSPSDGGWRRA